MPTYPVKNRVTGEEKELSMTMKAYDDWRKENQTGIKTGQRVVLLHHVSLSGLEKQHPVDGMKY